MKQNFTALLAISVLALVAAPAGAQTTFRIGPKASYTLSSASFTVADYPDYFSTPSTYGSGFEAGVVAQVGFGNHFALQPAVLYARKAPGYGTTSYYAPNNFSYKQEYVLKLNYVTVPVNLLYSQRPNGHGGQVFGGPYVGWLLGGTYTAATGSARGAPVANTVSTSGDVKPGDTYSNNRTYYLRQLDAGAQVGVGYGFDALQVQASFSLGLRDIGAAYAPNAGNPYEAPVICNRGFQVSAAYLFGAKN